MSQQSVLPSALEVPTRARVARGLLGAATIILLSACAEEAVEAGTADAVGPVDTAEVDTHGTGDVSAPDDVAGEDAGPEVAEPADVPDTEAPPPDLSAPDVPDTSPPDVGPPDDTCKPSCAGKFCGPDGCGGVCGACLAGFECSDAGQCQPIPPTDACLEPADAQLVCTVDIIEASSDCTFSCFSQGPACASCIADATGLGAGCASCYGGLLSCAIAACAIQCFDAASPACEACVAQSCLPTLTACAGTPTCCIPDCAADPCGDDGCGGVCAACPDGQSCDAAGVCAAPAPNGETCLEARELVTEGSGDTSALTDDLALTIECPSPFEGLGSGTPDEFWAFTPAGSAEHSFHLTPNVSGAAAPTALYLLTSCEDLALTCPAAGAVAEDSSGVLSFTAVLEQGVTVYLVVDGAAAGDAGSYTLSVDAPCIPACDGKACGPNGCGGTCGECSEGTTCEDTACVPVPCEPVCAVACGDDGCGGSCGSCLAEQECDPVAGCVDVVETLGDTCGQAIPIEAIPALVAGSTLGATDDYALPSSTPSCELLDGAGAGAPDVVYSFTPTQSGNYGLQILAPSLVIYLVTDCADIFGSCLAMGSADPATEVPLTAGVTYYFVVDGLSVESADLFELFRIIAS